MANERKRAHTQRDASDSPATAKTPSPEEAPLVEPSLRHPAGDPTAAAVARELHWLEKLNILGQLSLVVVGIIAASIYGCQLHTMNDQVDQMKRQAEILGKQLELSQRPWIQVDGISSKISFSNGGPLTIEDALTLRNVGNSPAVHIGVWAVFVPLLPTKTMIDKTQAVACEMAPNKGFSTSTIFPGNIGEIKLPFMGVSAEQIRKELLRPTSLSYIDKKTGESVADLTHSVDPNYWAHIDSLYTTDPRFFLIGCLDYGQSYSTEHHQSKFAYDLRKLCTSSASAA